VLAILAGARRYYRSIGLVYMDSDADLNTPATSASGSVDGMVISHIVGRGAAEMVRFWGEPPLVREPDILLFGANRIDASEEQYLSRSPMPRHLAAEISKRGGTVAAEDAAQRAHASQREFVLHFDVDVISGREFPATNYPSLGAISLADARQALNVFARQPQLAGVNICAYNPELDADGSYAKLLIDLIVEALEKRIAAPPAEPPSASAPNEAAEATTPATEPAQAPENVAAAPSVSSTEQPAAVSEPAAETSATENSETSSDAPAESEPPNPEPANS
jgi:arginase